MIRDRYSWCGVDPLCCSPPPPCPSAPAIPKSIEPESPDSKSQDGQLSPVPNRAAGDEEPLVAVDHPRISVIEAYRKSGWPFAVEGAFLRRKAMVRLGAAADLLPVGFGLAVWDAWRDRRLQQALHDEAYADPGLPPGFVARPSDDPRFPPPHATGGTVDVTLTWESVPLALGTGFDDFVPDARPEALELVADDDPLALSRDLRRLLRQVLVDQGFVPLGCEWWHFEYGTRLWAARNHQPARYHAHPGPFEP